MIKRKSALRVAQKSQDYFGVKYIVNKVFMRHLLGYLIYNKTSNDLPKNYLLTLKDYTTYMKGEYFKADTEQMIALDIEVFKYIISNDVLLGSLTEEQLNNASSLFCEFSKIDQDLDHAPFADVVNMRLGAICNEEEICAR